MDEGVAARHRPIRPLRHAGPRRNWPRRARASHRALAFVRASMPAAAATAAENSAPATLATTSIACSSAVRRSTCFSTICHSVSGAPSAMSSTGTASPHCRPPHGAAPDDQVVDRVHQEQRVAVGPAMECRRQLRWRSCGQSAGRDTRATAVTLRNSQRDLVTLAVELELVLGRLQRMLGAATSAGRYVPTISKRDASRRRASIASRSIVAESLQCRSSRTQDERRVAVRTSSAFDQLSQHPLARRPLRPALHGLQLLVGQQRRQLREPGRRVLLEDLNQLVAARARGPRRPSASSTGR